MIDARSPCYAYFDLEFKRDDDASRRVDGESLSRRVAGAAAAVVRDRFRASPKFAGKTLSIDAVFLDSCRETKFSQHVVLRSFAVDAVGRRFVAPLAGSATAKLVAAGAVERLVDDFDKKAVDLGVYTQSRCFRLAGSSKFGDATPLMPTMRLRYDDAGAHPLPPPLPTDLAQTLVVPEPSTVDVIDFPAQVVPEARPDSTTDSPPERREPTLEAPTMPWFETWIGATTRPLLDLTFVKHEHVRCQRKGSGMPPSPLARLAEWARDVAKSRLPAATVADAIAVYQWRYVWAEYPTERYLHLTLKGTRYCHARGRQHKNHNVVLSVDAEDGSTWQRCWDKEDCHVAAKTKAGGDVLLAAKYLLDQAPADVLPSRVDLAFFEMKDRPRQRSWTSPDGYDHATHSHDRGGD